MRIRFIALVTLALCHMEGSVAIPGIAGLTGFVINNSEAAGIKLPGYVKMLSSKSSFLTYVLHFLFGNHFEERMKKIMEIAALQMPDEAAIDNVDNDNPEKMTFHNGKMSGLKSIQVTPNTDVNVIWSETGLPVAVVSVKFKELRINADIKTSFKWKTVDGNADMKFLDNNFVLKFYVYPGLFEWCFLKLYDVVVSDLEDLEWTVRRRSDNTVDNLAGMAMQGYFTSTDGEVEEHIKTTIANVIYHEIPKASPAICDNKDKYLKLSKYETFKKSNYDQEKIMKMLENEAKGGA